MLPFLLLVACLACSRELGTCYGQVCFRCDCRCRLFDFVLAVASAWTLASLIGVVVGGTFFVLRGFVSAVVLVLRLRSSLCLFSVLWILGVGRE